MNAGMTRKQFAEQEFFERLQEYRNAKSPRELIVASVRLHAASGAVPKRYQRFVRAAYQERKEG